MGHILHVIPYFVPAYGFGGPVKVCLDLAATQVRAGHRVSVLTTDALDEHTRVSVLEETIEGIEVVRLRNLSTQASKRYNLFLPVGLGAWLDARLHELRRRSSARLLHVAERGDGATLSCARHSLRDSTARGRCAAG